MPTPSDSQDGARRRDDAVPPGRCGNRSPRLWGDFPARETCDLRVGHAGWHESSGGQSWTRLPETEAEPCADVARLEAERDEARADAGRMRLVLALHGHGVDPNGYYADTPGSRLRELLAAEAERELMRPVVEAAKAALALHSPPPGWEREWKDPDEALREGWPKCAGCTLPNIGYRTIGSCPTRKALAAVDQTAPSSPLETRHTADSGEAGVVEGAGGSEAAEAMYEAAAQAMRDACFAAAGTKPTGAWKRLPETEREWYRIMARAVWPLAVAEGRRQAARQIIARDEAEGDWDVNVAYWVAVGIAEGTDA